jgi:MFS family permease
MITQKAGKREQGVIMGLTQSLTSVAQIGAPVLAGILIDHQFLTIWAIWAGVLCGVALLFTPPAKTLDATL